MYEKSSVGIFKALKPHIGANFSSQKLLDNSKLLVKFNQRIII